MELASISNLLETFVKPTHEVIQGTLKQTRRTTQVLLETRHATVQRLFLASEQQTPSREVTHETVSGFHFARDKDHRFEAC